MHCIGTFHVSHIIFANYRVEKPSTQSADGVKMDFSFAYVNECLWTPDDEAVCNAFRRIR